MNEFKMEDIHKIMERMLIMNSANPHSKKTIHMPLEKLDPKFNNRPMQLNRIFPPSSSNTNMELSQKEKMLRDDILKGVENIVRKYTVSRSELIDILSQRPSDDSANIEERLQQLQFLAFLQAMSSKNGNDGDSDSDDNDSSDDTEVDEKDGDSSEHDSAVFCGTNDKIFIRDKKLESDMHLAKIRTKLMMTVIKKAISKDYPFLWGAEMNKSHYANEILSNFVIRSPGDENKFQFLSARYEEKNEINKKIRKIDIFEKHGEYSIHKFFKSFCDAIEDSLFNETLSGKPYDIADIIIITNKELDCKRIFDSHELQDNEFSFIKEGAIVSSIKTERYDDIKQQINPSQDYGKYVLPFLQKLKFISFPNEEEFNIWLDNELKDDILEFLDATEISSISADQNSFLNFDGIETLINVKAGFLTPVDGKTLFNEMAKQFNNLMHREISRDNICKLKSYGLSFESNYVDELKKRLSADKRLIVISTECPQLSAIKILQNYKSWNTIKTAEWLHDNDFIFVNSDGFVHYYETQNIIKKSFYSDQCPNLLLIECVSMNVSDFFYIINTCTEWLESVAGKQIIIIIEDKHESEFIDLFRMDKNIHVINDKNISFKHLTTDVQENILEEKEGYIDGLTENDARELMHPQCLWQLVAKNTFNKKNLSRVPFFLRSKIGTCYDK
ncbi:uncharacterized protein LOC129568856 [Sitodiplosis mosellana]|uniref:uncharacterized protein LOC129568856 n=1 Tax=Sitodiplosis mosellana TaxID=263140 RepID=UPI00244428C1|nr:uncharacterized protein LOC129568856 [Sitodiplosis mosellana]XP_055303158.1 uncharacterized protein LOC129568856 [Sitodiplosis mosellana]